MIREYYLAPTPPLFRRTSALFHSLSKIVLEIMGAYFIVKIELVKRVTAKGKKRLLQSE